MISTPRCLEHAGGVVLLGLVFVGYAGYGMLRLVRPPAATASRESPAALPVEPRGIALSCERASWRLAEVARLY